MPALIDAVHPKIDSGKIDPGLVGDVITYGWLVPRSHADKAADLKAASKKFSQGSGIMAASAAASKAPSGSMTPSPTQKKSGMELARALLDS